MFDVVVHLGNLGSGRKFFSLPRVGDFMDITFVEYDTHYHCKIIKVAYQEMAKPDNYGNSDVPFAAHIYLEELEE